MPYEALIRWNWSGGVRISYTTTPGDANSWKPAAKSTTRNRAYVSLADIGEQVKGNNPPTVYFKVVSIVGNYSSVFACAPQLYYMWGKYSTEAGDGYDVQALFDSITSGEVHAFTWEPEADSNAGSPQSIQDVLASYPSAQPLILMGESYGGGAAVAEASRLTSRTVQGLYLFDPVAPIPGDALTDGSGLSTQTYTVSSSDFPDTYPLNYDLDPADDAPRSTSNDEANNTEIFSRFHVTSNVSNALDWFDFSSPESAHVATGYFDDGVSNNSDNLYAAFDTPSDESGIDPNYIYYTNDGTQHVTQIMDPTYAIPNAKAVQSQLYNTLESYAAGWKWVY